MQKAGCNCKKHSKGSKIKPCLPDTCQVDALKVANAYKEAQKNSLKVIQLQLETLCCALKKCNASTLSTVNRAIAVLETENNRTCAYPLFNPSAIAYEATLSGPTTATANGLGQVINVTEEQVDSFFIAGSLEINDYQINLNNSFPLSNAVAVAESIQQSISNVKCGIYDCLDISAVSYFRLFFALGEISVQVYDPLSATWETFNTIFAGDYIILANQINEALGDKVIASPIDPDVGAGIDIFVKNGYNLRVTGVVDVAILDSQGNQLKSSGLGLDATNIYQLTGIVEIDSSYAFGFSDLSLSLNNNPILVADETSQLLASYCPAYTDVHTFVCNGSNYLTLTAPQIPLNALIEELRAYPSLNPVEVAYLIEAVCNLVPLVELYLEGLKDDLLNYVFMEKSLAAYLVYCGAARPNLCCEVKNKYKRAYLEKKQKYT